MCLSLRNSVAPTPSGGFSFRHNTSYNGLKPTLFLLNNFLSSSTYFYLYNDLRPLFLSLEIWSSKSLVVLFVNNLYYIDLNFSHLGDRVITRISSLQIYLHNIYSHFFTLFMLSTLKHMSNSVLETCDESIIIHLTFFL